MGREFDVVVHRTHGQMSTTGSACRSELKGVQDPSHALQSATVAKPTLAAAVASVWHPFCGLLFLSLFSAEAPEHMWDMCV